MSLWWVLIGTAIFMIGLTKSGFGAGVGLLNVPVIVLAMGHTSRGSEAALGLMLPLLIIGDLIAVCQYRHIFSMSIVRRLLPGTLVGIVLGYLLLRWFHEHQSIVATLIRLEIGIESVLLVALYWWRQVRGIQENLLPEPIRSHVTGTFAGVSTTLAHAAGPIVTMYLLPLRLERHIFVGTCALYFFIANSLKLPFYYQAGLFEKAELPFTIQFAPLVLLGAWFGFWINRRLSDKLFSKIVYFVTFFLGWYLLISSILTLI
jgi:uncharacterized protein